MFENLDASMNFFMYIYELGIFITLFYDQFKSLKALIHNLFQFDHLKIKLPTCDRRVQIRSIAPQCATECVAEWTPPNSEDLKELFHIGPSLPGFCSRSAVLAGAQTSILSLLATSSLSFANNPTNKSNHVDYEIFISLLIHPTNLGSVTKQMVLGA